MDSGIRHLTDASRGQTPGRAALGHALPAELVEGLLGLLEPFELHAANDGRGLRELDVPVADDLDPVSPRIEEVEPAAREDLDASLFQNAAYLRLVVDDEPEVASLVRRLSASFGQREKLVPHVQEGHPRHTTAEPEVEETSVERQSLLEIPDLEGDVVDAD
jgi:hypothetical protein